MCARFVLITKLSLRAQNDCVAQALCTLTLGAYAGLLYVSSGVYLYFILELCVLCYDVIIT